MFYVITRKRDRTTFLLAYWDGLRASKVGMFQVADINLVQHRITLQRLKGSYSGILLCGLMKLRVDEIKAPKAYPQECTIESPMLFRSQRGTPISQRQLDTLRHYGEHAGGPCLRAAFSWA